MPPLWLILTVLCGVALLLGNPRMIATAAVLLADNLACIGLYEATGNDHLWMGMAVIDTIAAVIILVETCERPMLVIAALFILELLCHAAFGMQPNTPASIYYYWWSLYYIACAQIAMMIIWSGWDGVKMVRHRDNPDSRLWNISLAFGSHHAGRR